MNNKVAPTDNHPEASAIRRQVVLPLGKSIEIAFNSIRVRFFRSLITTLSLVLAGYGLEYRLEEGVLILEPAG